MIVVFIRTDGKGQKLKYELLKFLRSKDFAFSVKDAQDYFNTLKQITDHEKDKT